MISKNEWLDQIRDSYLYAGNAPFIEALYDRYLQAPDAVEPAWRAYFDELQSASEAAPDRSHAAIQQGLLDKARTPAPVPAASTQLAPTQAAAPTGEHAKLFAEKQAGVLRLIRAYRLFGHLRADLDPIQLRPKPPVPDLDIYFQGLTDQDRNTVFNAGTLVAPSDLTLDDIEKRLQQTYTGRIGLEYIHITAVEQRRWLQERFERQLGQPQIAADDKRRLLSRLTAAEGLERYLHLKYVGQKRFSLEGGESLIPMLETMIRRASTAGTKELVIGMAHRGRLNVLINIMGKMPSALFSIFEGKLDHSEVDTMSGDVKYHEGFSADYELDGGPMHIALAFNPSHLEIIDPVVAGAVRARHDRRAGTPDNVMGVLIHGDAAFWGQGVVYETFNLTQTRAYSSGGMIHIVVNNRIGFTLSNPLDYRSTLYCTDIGKVIQAPILHVNGDDPEACAYAMELAVDFRNTFHKDVIIDMICTRRHGHNEADEPAATQPMMYEKIRNHPTTRQVYADKLISQGVVSEADAEAMVDQYQDALESNASVAPFPPAKDPYPYVYDWPTYLKARWNDPAETALPVERLKRLGTRMTTIPEGFVLHPRVQKIIDDRRKMSAGALPLDWGCAETLAYASLLEEGFAVRIAGQDSGRGTFFHRHAVLHNQRTGENHVPLQHIQDDQPRFTIVDTILSEEAVLAFEYGYAMTNPETLVIWEAQFGDFVNGAQVVIDQFLSSSEQKWRKLCGLVLMLPHGWEGQGPEHTSARLERFLQLCAQDNMQVCVPTTPAQMFHMLRREMVRNYRKPLIIMSPKSMLRRKLSFSPLETLSRGTFQVVIGETEKLDPAQVRRVVLCSGKVYYDLLEQRQANEQHDVALLRIEQLYPFPKEALSLELNWYLHADEIIWAQEEPMNQGAWYAIQHNIRECMLPHQSLSYVGRLRNAAPSGGHHELHMARQRRLVEAALNTGDGEHHPILVFHPLEPKLEKVRR
jgi:2-oxoglutarate dehydrogenase E1 component